MKKFFLALFGSSLILLIGFSFARAQEGQEAEKKIHDILRQMTLEEKISMLSGTGFESRPVARLGIPALNMTDGPVGVRWHRSTAFPASIALAAAWDPALATREGSALGREAKAEGRRMLLGPCVNINRVPWGGRDFESYGEDPYLVARVAVGYVKGVQSEKVVACTKHYAANNQEWERESISAQVDERTLREIYFPAFQAAVQEGGSWSIMSAYNKVNGTWCSENPFLLTDVLKREWGFKGMVVSDWGAVHSMVPTVNAGLDIEMPNGQFLRGDSLLLAVRRGDVKEPVIDDKITRILRVIMWTGLLNPQPAPDSSIISSAQHRALAREVADEGTVLLKNTMGLLPLDAARVHSIAVIGPSAEIARTGGGGSSMVVPLSKISPLQGIKARGGNDITVRFARGCMMDGDVAPVESAVLRPAGGKERETGLRGEYFANPNFEGQPLMTRIDPAVDFEWGGGAPAAGFPEDHFSIRWTGLLVPPETGEFELSTRSDDGSRLFIDDTLLIDNWGDHGIVTKTGRIHFEKGKTYALRIEYYENTGGATMQLGWRIGLQRDLQEAVDAAAHADIAVVVVGNSTDYESEGFDRKSLSLPAGQDELIAAVAKANPRTVVVLVNGAPVLMPWIENVPAVVEAWFGGQEGGAAIADVLFGDVNPSGKLPVTFPKAWNDSPASSTYPGKDGKTEYAEGIFIGYRYFDHANVEPLFPFGFGLSYTTFSYSHLVVVPGPGHETYSVTLDVTNTGTRAGAEVVQVYVSEEHASVPRPPKELKAFSRIALQPGETKTVHLTLGESSFAFFHPMKKQWEVEPGTYTVAVGSSSRDVRLSQSLEIK